MERSSLSLLRAQGLVLSLRFSRSDLAQLRPAHLVFGLLVAWAVGLGRYWDHPHPYAFQSLGVGSLAVLGVLGLLLYVLLAPLRPRAWSLLHLYTFLALTALPGLVYAIPVERHLELEQAQTVNAWFLAAVAAWRVAMLVTYLRRWAGLEGWVLTVGLLLPLSLVITTLTVLNLEQVVFLVMSGERELSPNDTAFEVLVDLTFVSVAAFPFLLIGYGVAVYRRRRSARKRARRGSIC